MCGAGSLLVACSGPSETAQRKHADGPAGGASGVVCGVGVAGVSDAGGLLVGGGSGAGVCDAATPVKQSSTSAELLRRCKRLLRILITAPPIPDGNDPSARKIDASRRNVAARVPARRSLARPRAGTRSMSGGGRCARRKARALRFGEVERERRLGWQAAKDIRQGQGRRLGRYQRASEMDQRADRTAVVRTMISAGRIDGPAVRVTPRIGAGDREWVR